MRTLWQITAPHYTAGLEVEDGVITTAAPILNWTVGFKWHDVRMLLEHKGYHGTPVTIPDDLFR